TAPGEVERRIMGEVEQVLGSMGECRTMTVDEGTLTPNQAARRARVLEAALALAAEGGYDAVQMRDVASRAQVALGTIYRYFSSKDHLLAECQLETWRTMRQRLERRPLQGTTAAE